MSYDNKCLELMKVAHFNHPIACLANVSVQNSEQKKKRKITRNGIFDFDCARTNRLRGGRKETLADKPLEFENLRLPANAVPDWLGQSNNIDMCRSKVCFILRGHVWYVTRIFLRLLFILVGKIYPPVFPPFHPHPLPTLSLAPFLALSLSSSSSLFKNTVNTSGINNLI